eukprot:Nitzschia sp. Nitz4//scaffold327_size20599//3154//4283//NITZ4_008634-RA/size20599-augustus-gene-0.3-mRNA-1//-1//CDS//3329547940//1841//frame0
MFSHSRIFSIVCACLFLTNYPSVKAAYEPYSYTAYYDGSNECDGTIVMLNAHVSGDDEYAQGAMDLETSKCSIESVCLVGIASSLCAEYATNISGVAHTAINRDGDIFQCDTTNEDVDQDQCRYIKGCGSSSLFPDCRFILMTTSDVFEDLDQIRNVNAYEDEDLALTSYMTFYSDDECTEFEGTQGIVAGETELMTVSDSISCEASLACIFNPDGETCTNSGALTGENATIRTLPATANAILCTDETDESCAEVDAAVCTKSDVVPNCWYRLSTSYRLFTQPEYFFVSSKYPIAKETDAPTATVSTEPDSSAMLVHWSSCLWCMMVMAALLQQTVVG